MSALLTATNLSCERDYRLLFENLNFSLMAGDVWQLEGANGSGKTTLLRILTGLYEDFTGELSWQGEPMHRARQAWAEGTQYLGHLPGIKRTLTPQENLNWYLGLYGIQADISTALAKVGLSGYEDVPCAHLSAGQQRRVNLARLYLLPAKLWLLDEPFTAIDKAGVAVIETAIAEFVAQGGAVMLTTHQDLNLPVGIKRLSLNAGGAVSVVEVSDG